MYPFHSTVMQRNVPYATQRKRKVSVPYGAATQVQFQKYAMQRAATQRKHERKQEAKLSLG